MDDAEPNAMLAIARILAALPDNDARRRVLSWAADKAGVAPMPRMYNSTDSKKTDNANAVAFETFAELFDAARPSSEKEKAILAAYWRTKVDGAAQFVSQELNKLLTDLGYKIQNITDALSAAMQEKPALILQLRKSGSTRQARKTYKISEAGIRFIEAKIAERDS
jgi:hypothetical protein